MVAWNRYYKDSIFPEAEAFWERKLGIATTNADIVKTNKNNCSTAAKLIRKTSAEKRATGNAIWRKLSITAKVGINIPSGAGRNVHNIG